MNENLKVNSKTDILEFKRKHNLLVENGTIKANVSNIKSLSNDVINNLRCGDIVLKEDSTGKHAYLVSFKSDTGLCLTYCDASCVETQSYDKSGDNWAYNSEDKCDLINANFNSVHANEIIENMNGYSAIAQQSDTDFELEPIFAGAVKNGNKLTFVYAVNITKLSTVGQKVLINFTIPSNIGDKLFPSILGDNYLLESKNMPIFSSKTSSVNAIFGFYKINNTTLRLWIENSSNLVVNTKYYARFEITLLLSENLIPQGE